MKRIVLALSMALPFFALGQQLSKDFKVSTGTPYEVVDAVIKDYTPVGNEQILSVKVDGERVSVQKFDSKTMKEICRKWHEDFPKYAKFQKLIQAGDNYYYIFEAYNKKEKTFTVYSREVDLNTCSLKPSKKLLTSSRPVTKTGEMHAMAGFSMWGSGLFPKFDVITSFDKSKVLIRYRLKPESRRDAVNKDELGFYVFDASMNKVWGKEVKMPHTEKEMNNLAYTVGKDNVAYMLSYINEKKKFELITVTESGVTNKILPVKDGLVFQKFDLREHANGNILAAGYYANGIDFKVNWTGSMSTSMNVNGLYIFEIDKKGEVVNKKDYPFSLDFIQQNLSDRQAEKAEKREEDGKAGIGDLVLREFKVQKDGSIIIVGEVNYTRNEMWMMGTDLVTHYGNIVMTKISADGELLWRKKLPKNQAALADRPDDVGTLGLFYANGNDSHYVLFLDNAKNADLGVDEVPAAHKGGHGGFLTAYKVNDATGDVEKHLIQDLSEELNGENIYQFYMSRIEKAKDNAFLVEVYIKKKRDNMIKIELK